MSSSIHLIIQSTDLQFEKLGVVHLEQLCSRHVACCSISLDFSRKRAITVRKTGMLAERSLNVLGE